MKKNFKITIEYDGTNYHGWQRQKGDMTIQQAIEDALFKMTKEKVTLIGSGRTDAGVHALNQVANFKCDTAITPDAFQSGLNSITKEDIIIKSCIMVDSEFHSRFSAKSKRYCYHILNTRRSVAIGRQYHWHIAKNLDIPAMENAITRILGEHDFKAFEATGSPRDTTIRTVMDTHLIKKEGGRLHFEIKANGFLRYMVRNIVGTLVEIGLHKIDPNGMETILLSKDRGKAGITAPAKGLFLVRVNY